MWAATVLVAISGLVFMSVRLFTVRQWAATVWLGLAILLVVCGQVAGAWAADRANPTFEPWTEVRTDYEFERYFSAIVPVMPACAAATACFWRALLGWSRPGSRFHQALSSKGCAVLCLVGSLLAALVAAAAAS